MQSKAVLYVEDDENDVFLMRHVFKRARVPHPLLVVTDGVAAINYLNGGGPYQNRQAYPFPSLVLLDLKLPGLSGFEVLHWLRAQGAYRELPVVVFSSSGQPSDIQEAYAAGADAYIVKPGSLETFMQIIHGLEEFLVAPTPDAELLVGTQPKTAPRQLVLA